MNWRKQNFSKRLEKDKTDLRHSCIFLGLVYYQVSALSKLFQEHQHTRTFLWGHQPFNCVRKRLCPVSFEQKCLQCVHHIICRIKFTLPTLQNKTKHQNQRNALHLLLLITAIIRWDDYFSASTGTSVSQPNLYYFTY